MHAIPISGAQIRAGRALLHWSVQELADASKLEVTTIQRADAADEPPPIAAADAAAIRQALEAGGVEFIWEHGKGVGVRFARHRALRGEHMNFVSDGNEG